LDEPELSLEKTATSDKVEMKKGTLPFSVWGLLLPPWLSLVIGLGFWD